MSALLVIAKILLKVIGKSGVALLTLLLVVLLLMFLGIGG
jgi:hypothetical protein